MQNYSLPPPPPSCSCPSPEHHFWWMRTALNSDSYVLLLPTALLCSLAKADPWVRGRPGSPQDLHFGSPKLAHFLDA